MEPDRTPALLTQEAAQNEHIKPTSCYTYKSNVACKLTRECAAGEPAHDPLQLAAAEAERLAGADCVLCSYEVLQSEALFDPHTPRLASLRHEKKYQVPVSPLLSLR